MKFLIRLLRPWKRGESVEPRNLSQRASAAKSTAELQPVVASLSALSSLSFVVDDEEDGEPLNKPEVMMMRTVHIGLIDSLNH
jgi:hypothetical protein